MRYGEIVDQTMDALREAGLLRDPRLRDSYARMIVDLVAGALVRAGGDYPLEQVRGELHRVVDLFLDGALKPSG
jgi:hypothetical protein